MSRRSVFIHFSAALAMALVLALLFTLSAQAQDEPPPPEAPAAPPAAPKAANPGAGDVTGQDPAPPPLATADLQLYSGPDPWFTCSGAEPPGDPNPGNGRCEYIGAGTLTTAIAEFAFRGGSGLITCENGGYTGNPFINAIPNLTGIVSVNGSGITAISGRVEITGQTSGFILRGFAIGTGTNSTSPLLWMYNNSGAINLTDIILNDNTLGPGLEIENHTGSVTLERVQVDNNASTAARNYIARIITNTAATGNITITNSSFDDNLSPAVDGGITLILYSNAGKLSMNGVSVSNNNVGDGMLIFATKGITVKNSRINDNGDTIANAFGVGLRTLSDTSGSLLFENVTVISNENSGLAILARGAITIRNGEISQNGGNGIDVNNCYFDGVACNPGGSYGVSIYNAYLFDNNTTGVVVESNGDILLDGVRALDSGVGGTILYNQVATSSRSVTIYRSQFLDTDVGTGLAILSRGSVKFNHVLASGSLGGSGAVIDNAYSLSAGVTLLNSYGYNDFSFNSSKGLVISTNGSISFKQVGASSNNADGIDLTGGSPRNVTIDGLYGLFNGAGGAGSGLLVTNTGTISLKNFALVSNHNAGAILDNLGAPASSFPSVTLVNGEIINNQNGLIVDTLGAISLNKVNSYGNTGGLGGADLDNCHGMPCISSRGVTVKDSQFFSNVLGASGGPGLFIQSGGAISLTNVTGVDNYEEGLYAHNNSAAGSPGITIRNGKFSGSVNGYGADLLTKGAISLTNITAEDNHVSGMYAVVLGNKSITMSVATGGRNTFTNNVSTGLYLLTEGSISVRGVTSSNPAATGVYLYNAYPASSAGITLQDVDSSDNGGRGIVVQSHGAISAAGLVAFGNGTSGATNYYAVILDNCDHDGAACTYAGSERSISLTAYGKIENTISNNSKSGLGIFTFGSITLRDAYVSGNPGTSRAGAQLESWGAGKTVSVSNSEFHANGNTGLKITSEGNVSLSGVAADNNATAGASNGISIFTQGSVSLSNVITRANRVENIIIGTAGKITLTNVEANDSITSTGININNNFPPAGNVVILKNVSATGNQVDNIYVVSNGAISGSGITCDNSVTGYGCFFQNTNGTAGITLNNSSGANSASGNALGGIYLDTFGPISLTGVTASNNHSVGIINGSGVAGFAGQIKLDKVRAEGNWSDGIVLKSNATPIRISNSIVMGNTFNGIDVTFVGGVGNQLIVKNTLFFGNDRFNAGNPNIQVINGIVVIQ